MDGTPGQAKTFQKSGAWSVGYKLSLEARAAHLFLIWMGALNGGPQVCKVVKSNIT